MRVMPTEKDFRNKKQAEKGWILEADSEYPPELHKDHNSYSLAPEEKVMKIELSSDYPDLAEQQRKAGSHTARQKKYVLHYRNLLSEVKLGMRLQKVHRALEFTQECWAEPHIWMNTEYCRTAVFIRVLCFVLFIVLVL